MSGDEKLHNNKSLKIPFPPCIVQVQLLMTLGFVFLFTFHGPSRQFAATNMWLAITAIILAFATIIAISCCEGVRRTSPHNFIVLAIFTIAEGYVVGMSTFQAPPEVVSPFCTFRIEFWVISNAISHTKFEKVLQAVGLTAIVVIALTIFAIQTKWDFTMMGGLLFVFLILFTIISLILGFTSFGRSNAGSLVLSGFGVLLFAVYLICEYYHFSSRPCARHASSTLNFFNFPM